MTGTSGNITVSGLTTHRSRLLAVEPRHGGSSGTPFSVTVTALDQYGNVATGYTGTVHFTSSDGQAVLPANYTFTAGDAASTPSRVTLEDGRQPDDHGHRHRQPVHHRHRAAITVSAAAASLLRHRLPGDDHGGQRLQLHGHGRGRLRQHGHRLHRHGPLHQQRRPGRSCRPTTPSRPATTASTPSRVTLKTAGSQTITATDTVDQSITGTSSTITVSAAAGHALVGQRCPSTDHGGQRLQRHGHGPGRRINNIGHRLHRHGPLHQQRPARPSCRPTTPS